MGVFSIGVIGGADGPTAVFVSGPVDGWLWLTAAFIVVAIAVVTTVLLVRKARKKGKK